MNHKLKFRYIIILLIFVFLLIEFFVNIYLFFGKEYLIKRYFGSKDVKIGKIYYLLPNILIIKNLSYTTDKFKIDIDIAGVCFLPEKIFKKTVLGIVANKFIITSFLSTDTFSEEKIFEEKEIVNFFSSLPLIASIKNFTLYNEDKLLFENVKVKLYPKGEEIFFDFRKGSSYLTFVCNNKTRLWRTNFDIYQSIDFFPLTKFKGEFYGSYNLAKLSRYKITSYIGPQKVVFIGDIIFSPIKILSKVKSELFHGEISVLKDGGKFYLSYKGDIFLTETFRDFFNLTSDKVEINADLTWWEKNYKYNMVVFSEKIMFNAHIEDGKGYLKLYEVQPLSRRKLLFDGLLLYDNMQHQIVLSSKSGWINLNLDLSERKFSGNIKNTKISGGIKRDNSLLNSYFLVEKVNKDGSSVIDFSANFDNVSKKGDFQLKSRNLLVYNTRVDCAISGEIFSKEDRNYSDGVVKINYLNVNKNTVVENVKIEFIFKHSIANFKLFSEDDKSGGEISYNIETGKVSGNYKIEKPDFILGKFRFDLVSDITLSGRINEISVECDYMIKKLKYNNTLFVEELKGKVGKRNDSFIATGIVNLSKSSKFRYEIIPYLRKKKVVLNLKDILLDNKNMNFFLSLEPEKDLFSLFSDNIYVKGKIVSKDSEITIMPGSKIDFKKDFITLNLKLKNFVYNNISFFGNMKIDIENIQDKNQTKSTISFSNFWVNNYNMPQNKFHLIYKKKLKKIQFFTPENVSDFNQLLCSGEIFLLDHNRIRISNVNIYTERDKKCEINGYIGKSGDRLNVKFTKFPFEIVKNIFILSFPDIQGELNAEIVFQQKTSAKGKYYIFSNFVLRSVEFLGLNISSISGIIKRDDREIIIDDVKLFFKEQQKIVTSGRYNPVSKNLKLSINSVNCDLSLFDNFGDIIKTGKGRILVNLMIEGDLPAPKIYGSIKVISGELYFFKYLDNLKNINVNIDFKGEKIKITKFEGSYKTTKLVLSGDIKFPLEYDIKVRTLGEKGIYLTIPELPIEKPGMMKMIGVETTFPSYGEVKCDLTIVKRKEEKPKIQGEFVLENTHFSYPVKKEDRRIVSKRYYYDIKIRSGKNLWYEGENFSANIDGEIGIKHLPGMEKIIVNGELVSSRGNINFIGVNFRLRTGRVQVVNNKVYLEISGETNIKDRVGRNMPVQLIIERAPIEDIRPKLVSLTEPQLKSEDIIGLILGVKEINYSELIGREEIVSRSGVDYATLFLRQQVVRVIDSSLATPLAKNILQRYGIVDAVSVSYTPVEKKEDDSNRTTLLSVFEGTKYSFEKYLTPDMVIGYSIVLGEYQQRLQLQHEIEIAYRLKGNIFLKGIHGFGRRDVLGRLTPETRIGVEPVWRFGGEKWEDE